MSGMMQRTWSRLTRPQGRRLRIAGAGFSLLLAMWLLFSFLAVYSLTRRSRIRFTEPLPQAAGLDIEAHRLHTSDGEEIGAWYVAGQPELPTIVLIHGNGGQRRSCWPQAEMLLRAKYSVMLITCRAHGDSTGQINDVGWSARHDVIAAVTWLRQRRPQSKVILWGASLGSAASVFAAEALDGQVDGFILECPYQDLDTAVRQRLEVYLPPLVDRVCYVGMRLSAYVLMPQMDQISPLKHISSISREVPVLILAGENDRRARPAEALALRRRIKEHCRCEIIKDAGHLELMQADPKRYEELVLGFLEKIR